MLMKPGLFHQQMLSQPLLFWRPRNRTGCGVRRRQQADVVYAGFAHGLQTKHFLCSVSSVPTMHSSVPTMHSSREALPMLKSCEEQIRYKEHVY